MSIINPNTDAELDRHQELVRWLKQFRNFTFDEVACKCEHSDCPAIPMESAEFANFMVELQHLRSVLQFPFHMTSIYRCPAYNDMIYVRDFEAKTGEHLDGPHTKGAGDMLISFERMYKLIAEATSRDMGVGIKQHGQPEGRFMHLDNLGARLWTYP